MIFAGSTSNPEAYYDKQREREFYRYYDPIRALSASGPRWTDLYDEAAARQHRPSSCPDLSLTAFCQLGALRLGARRCMLFFFDCSNAYVLAEATRTLSLHDEDSHETGDGLWLGYTVIPRGLSVCEHTVNMSASPDNGGLENKEDPSLLHIIEDMCGNTTFCDRPYVTDGPKARFYAGVPLITPAGIRIGAFCVLDDQPRQGLNQSEVKFMLEMGKTVMAHLETVRERAEFGRGTRMLKGLRSFIQDTTSQRVEEPTTYGNAQFPKEDDYSSNENKAELGTIGDDQECKQEEINNTETTTTTTTTASLLPDSYEQGQIHSESLSDEKGSQSRGKPVVPTAGASQVFWNAADLVRDAMDAEGCLYLNASSSAAAESVTKRRHRRRDSDQSSGATDTGSDCGDEPRNKQKVGGCSVLGQSLRSSDGRSEVVGTISPSTLQRLLHKYPRGKIWIFDSDGDMMSSDQMTDTHIKQPSPSKKTRYSTANDAAELRAHFPQARSLCLVGLRDLTTQGWRAAVLIWSHSPVRVFSVGGELAFVIAFGEVIMAEIAALEAKREEKKRSDFVSTISHELRSPLHGILGSVDMLNQDHPSLHNSTDMKQIESCTLTMLDLVEHLLSYAEDTRDSRRRRMTNEVETPDAAESQSARPRSLDLSPGISIARATEEIAGVLMHSHQCDNSNPGSQSVDMALNIAVRPEYLIKAGVGDWKRLCSIIIGNALKFSEGGLVTISLDMAQKRKRTLAILTVSDTGCGMSQSFIDDSLFRPFQQADSLRVGMGLGLSLASKLVRALGGKIQVRSERNIGTTFRLTVPIETLLGSEIPEALDPLSGLKIKMNDSGVVGNSTRGEINELLKKSFKLLGAEIVTAKEASIIVLFDDDLEAFERQQDTDKSTGSKPLLVLCRDLKTIQRFRETRRSRPIPPIEYIAQPYGPQRLIEATQLCLGYGEGGTEPEVQDVKNTTFQVECQSSQFAVDALRSALASVDIASTDPTSVGPQQGLGDAEAGASQEPRPIDHPAIKRESITITTTSMAEGAAKDPAPQNPTAALTTKSAVSELSLLLVDDNPINLRLIVTYASKKSHPYRTATNGKEAVDAYEESITSPDAARPKPDVILLDINMPIMDGFEAARCIRRVEQQRGVSAVTIIALTGLGSEEARREAMESGIDLFLTKPVRLKELATILAGVKQGGEEGHRKNALRVKESVAEAVDGEA